MAVTEHLQLGSHIQPERELVIQGSPVVPLQVIRPEQDTMVAVGIDPVVLVVHFQVHDPARNIGRPPFPPGTR